MTGTLKPLLPFEAYQGISWSRAIVTVLRWWPVIMIFGARLFVGRRRVRGLLTPNLQNISLVAAASAVGAVYIFYSTWKQRTKAWRKLYSLADYDLVALPSPSERYYLPCEQNVGFARYIGVLLVGPEGLRFVAQRYEKPPAVLPFDALRVMGPLRDVSVSLEPARWWRSSGFANAKQRIKVTWGNYSTLFWAPYPLEVVAELNRAIQEALTAQS